MPPRAPLLAALLVPLLTPLAGATQDGCEASATTTLTAAPSLEGFRLLFQQNGVSFYGRSPGGDPARPTEVVLRNGNRHPVEVSYSLELGRGGDSLPRTVSLGRHCAYVPAGQYAVTVDSLPGATGSVRLRNLSIADLSQAPVTPAEGLVAPIAGAPVGVASTPTPAPAPASESSTPRTLPTAASTPAQDSTRTASAGSRAPTPVASRPRDPGVGARAPEAAYAAFFLLSATFMVLAGLGLLLPLLAGIALVLSLGAGALLRRLPPA